MSLNAYKVIEGKMPSYKEMRVWTNQQWMDYFRFAEHYMLTDPDGSEHFDCTMDKIADMENYLQQEDHPFVELIYRVGQWQDDTTEKKYYQKFNAMFLNCLTFLKKHPVSVSEEMRAFITTRHPKKMGWCLQQYEIKTTEQGETVIRDVLIPDGKTVSLPSFQQKMMTSLLKLADTYETILNSLSASDIREMGGPEKIKALKDLGFIFGIANKKISTTNINQFNFNGASAPKDVEKMLLDQTHKEA